MSDDPISVTMTSQLTGIRHTRLIPVDPAKFQNWADARRNGTAPFIQHAFPELSADDREFLLTGITPEEWERTFG